jgi:polyhydroxyalkanoate synthesis regulator phasin
MNNPLSHAFFIGRAFAEALGEQLENTVTNTLSELGKFDAEQRERLRQFTEDVMERARQAEAMATQGATGTTGATAAYSASRKADDVQEMVDNLRAETAQLRTELQRYRNQSGQ